MNGKLRVIVIEDDARTEECYGQMIHLVVCGSRGDSRWGGWIAQSSLQYAYSHYYNIKDRLLPNRAGDCLIFCHPRKGDQTIDKNTL